MNLDTSKGEKLHKQSNRLFGKFGANTHEQTDFFKTNNLRFILDSRLKFSILFEIRFLNHLFCDNESIFVDIFLELKF